MMEQSAIYRDLLAPEDIDRVTSAVRDDMRENTTPGAAAAMNLDPEGYWKSLGAAVEEALSLDIYDILIDGWCGWGDLRKLTGEEGPLDGVKRMVEILNHEMSSTHRPELEIRFELARGGPPLILTSKIAIKSKLRVGAVVITICDREIVAFTGVQVVPKISVGIRGRTITQVSLDPIALVAFQRTESPRLSALA